MSEEPTAIPPRGEGFPLDAVQFLTAVQIQDLVNRPVQTALASAIPPSSSHFMIPSLSSPPLQHGEPPSKKGKVSHKQKHSLAAPDSPTGEVNNMCQAVPSSVCQPQHPPDSDRPLGLRELEDKRHRSARRVKSDSYIDSSEEDSQSISEGHESDDYESEVNGRDAGDKALDSNATPVTQGEVILDALGEPFFHPDAISHPRSGEWSPLPQVAQYVELWARKALDRPARNKLRAECPRPFIPNKVVDTPEVDPILTKYLAKSGKLPKKGIERSFRTIQERVLDLIGPLTKILNLSEQAAALDQPVDLAQLRGWAQRAICLAGTANTTCSVERRRSILMWLDPQLSHLAETEPGPAAGGMLFGDNLMKFVGLFTGLDKAQTSLKRSGSNRVFPRAGRGRGRSAGRLSSYRPQYRPAVHYQYQQAPPSYTVPVAQPAPFFPPRSRPWRGRGYPRSRPPTGY
ncbi:uncharacterized protein LOC120939790 [Rana temporaria]|uniref:uncharacterized protein LOC120939790 n=1 Tax=Rana temporaria TaxID=8407 RepID=UPI001AAC6647|nr:uncharacterized protein LOC120939790 [Rana temporaria]